MDKWWQGGRTAGRLSMRAAGFGVLALVVWTGLSAVSLLVWFVLAMQCMSTVAIVRRETGGWRWPIFMVVYMNALAYGVCLVVYQVGSRLVG